MTLDDFLGGLVKLKQPEKGLRATSDSVLLAAGVMAKSGESVLDVGVGSGIIPLCMNARIQGLELYGLDCQKDLIDLARENANLNKCSLTLYQMDIEDKPSPIHGRQFHHVVTNPPFYTEPKARANTQVALAYQERIPLGKWLAFCMRHIRAKGTLTLIHRTESLSEILGIMTPKLGGIEIFPIVSKQGEDANRVILRGVMNSKKPLILHSPLVMHMADNNRTPLAEMILRQGKGIE